MNTPSRHLLSSALSAVSDMSLQASMRIHQGLSYLAQSRLATAGAVVLGGVLADAVIHKATGFSLLGSAIGTAHAKVMSPGPSDLMENLKLTPTFSKVYPFTSACPDVYSGILQSETIADAVKSHAVGSTCFQNVFGHQYASPWVQHISEELARRTYDLSQTPSAVGSWVTEVIPTSPATLKPAADPSFFGGWETIVEPAL